MNNEKKKGPIEFPPAVPPMEVTELSDAPLQVDCRELGGWCIVPELGRKAAIAECPPGGGEVLKGHYLHAVRPARAADLTGVEIEVHDWSKKDGWQQTTFFCGRLTDAHVQFLAVSAVWGGERFVQTYLAPGFDYYWGQGPRLLQDRGRFVREKDGSYRQTNRDEAAAGAGVYRVRIGERTWKCLRTIAPEEDEAVVISFLTERGETVLRRDCWAERFIDDVQLSTESDSPGGIILDGVRFVHRVDIVTHIGLGMELDGT